MGISTFLSGMLFGDKQKTFDKTQYPCAIAEIQKVVSQTNVRTLSKEEITLVESTIDQTRKGDGKISMAQIEEALRKLKNTHKISKSDYQGLMQMFAIHIAKKKYKT
ncbi:MAG: hypothetical protein GW939_02225 [Candidatus Magasanikbacteria bacterium]|uniref:Uncharacterized protein n=1 Tax=Candidatus Magasanikbacteria bacterium CG10_big_fil_rev_8_21_14_0_10_38_6 TaxID=1974647 RepID=A0A2M6P135_9BACT|nr:hypothetical protein [Candidatus Magasanikbacteria bacterium]NCS71902.1 hypothetical protein [Candidatus Magasanikbacteria bacterium]PIR77269.1 MAG: hypothetical protein COU30_03385 [Candidatus Magasanikbacteria bacterium CG10_big_fil_rev_8_21_14_0_10_38_6]